VRGGKRAHLRSGVEVGGGRSGDAAARALGAERDARRGDVFFSRCECTTEKESKKGFLPHAYTR
jgi:hypothetical protein